MMNINDHTTESALHTASRSSCAGAEQTTTMHILVTLNAGYLRPLNVMLSSLLDHNPGTTFAVHVLHSSLTEEQLRPTRQLLEPIHTLHAIPVDALALENAPVSKRYPKEMYYRIFAARYLPRDMERVLYLDPDIVIHGDVRELYAMPLGQSLFAAATHIRRIMHRLNEVRLDMDEESPYINSGVMLMNLTQLRREQREEDVFRYIETHKSKLLPDQDIISGLYGSRILALDPYRYNMTERLLALHALSNEWLTPAWTRQNTVILHYCGRNKPWKNTYVGQLGIFWTEAAARLENRGLNPVDAWTDTE